jgi:hypothetical protein
MIIGINGKIGSGKDTVGSIIQYLTAEDTGQFCLNRIHSGKSIEGHHNSTWEIKKFAGKLKQTASLLTGIPIEKFEDQEFKKTYLGEEWNSPYNIPFSGPDFVKHDGAMTVRTLLQRLGTEAMRDNLHENVWVNALFADYKAGDPEWDAFYPNWIITDMRFENELEAIVRRKGITIRVVRPGRTLTGTHPSEIALDGFIMHYEIINAGTIEDLIERVREILIKENII